MAYCTLDDLKLAKDSDRILEMATKLEGGSLIIDTEITDEAIGWASGEIDATLSPLYTTPITETVPEYIKGVCVRLALYFLYGRMTGKPDDQKEEYESLINQLTERAEKGIQGLSRSTVASIQTPSTEDDPVFQDVFT